MSTDQDLNRSADVELLPPATAPAAVLAALANAGRQQRWQELQAQLQAHGSYTTPPQQCGDWTSKLAPLRSLAFYSRVFAAVWRSSRRLQLLQRQGYNFDRHSRILTHAHEGRDVLRAAELAGAQVTVTGMEHVHAVKHGAIIVGNHMSSLETMVLAPIIMPHADISYVAKQSLMKYPVFGTVLTGLDAVIVSRTNAREDLRIVLNAGGEILTSGRMLIIFPQTTRSAVFDPKQFSSLPTKLAKRSKVPLIPLALTTDVWGTGRALKDMGPINAHNPVRFAFGPPIEVTDEKCAQQQLVEFIAGKLRSWGKTVID